jgi:hypothetical protein
MSANAKSFPRLLGTQFTQERRRGRNVTHMIFIVQSAVGRYAVTCFCAPSRKRKDGGCAHADAVLAAMKPWHRRRCRVEPYVEKVVAKKVVKHGAGRDCDADEAGAC